MKHARIKTLRLLAAHKKPGYLAACRKHGILCRAGQWLQFTDAAHAKIAVEYATAKAPACTKPQMKRLPSMTNIINRTAPPDCLPCRAQS